MPVIKGIIKTAQKTVIYGTEGIGKSTFASMFPSPAFIDTEGSTKNMDVDRYLVSDWSDILKAVEEVKREKVYKTVVIDTADWAETRCADFVCRNAGKKGIEDFGYGKGYTYLQEEFQKLLNLLDELIADGINVVITAHAKMRKFEQPDEMGAYDRWEMKLTKQVAPMVKEWADMVLFANYKTFAVKDENGKNKAQGGKRVMYTQHHPCWDAKNRHGLPAECEFDYKVIKHIVEGAEKPPKASKEEKPKEEPKKQTEAEKAASEGFATIHEELRSWMEHDKIEEGQLIAAVASKGGCQYDSKLEDLSPDFIKNNLMAKWSGFRKYCQKFASFTQIDVKEDDMPFE